MNKNKKREWGRHHKFYVGELFMSHNGSLYRVDNIDNFIGRITLVPCKKDSLRWVSSHLIRPTDILAYFRELTPKEKLELL